MGDTIEEPFSGTLQEWELIIWNPCLYMLIDIKQKMRSLVCIIMHKKAQLCIVCTLFSILLKTLLQNKL